MLQVGISDVDLAGRVGIEIANINSTSRPPNGNQLTLNHSLRTTWQSINKMQQLKSPLPEVNNSICISPWAHFENSLENTSRLTLMGGSF